MNATILHESHERIRLRFNQKRMTLPQADLLEAWLQARSWAKQVTVHERTCCAIIYYKGSREQVLDDIRRFSWETAEESVNLPIQSSRALNREFQEKLVAKLAQGLRHPGYHSPFKGGHQWKIT